MALSKRGSPVVMGSVWGILVVGIVIFLRMCSGSKESPNPLPLPTNNRPARVLSEQPKKKPAPTAAELEFREMNKTLSYIGEYGHGLYFFPATGPDFGYKFKLFFNRHTNLVATTIAGEVTEVWEHGDHFGITSGYWVLTKEK